MNNYERYTSRELFEAVKTAPENLRNYLIDVLLQREDRERYIREMLRSKDSQVLPAVLRSLPPADVARFRVELEGLLASGDAEIKRTIVDKWGQAREKGAVLALLGLIKNRNEDRLLKKNAIYTLGEIGDIAAFSPLSSYFDNTDADTRIAILIALNKINGEEAQTLFVKAGKDNSSDVRYWAEKFLKGAGDGALPVDMTIYRWWTRSLLASSDGDRLTMLSTGEGRYEEDKAGETTLFVDFHFRLETDGKIIFLSGSGKEYPTGYHVRKGVFQHPYEGNIPCLILEFVDKHIEINRVLITGTAYYWPLTTSI